jgi:hypothetical protein
MPPWCHWRGCSIDGRSVAGQLACPAREPCQSEAIHRLIEFGLAGAWQPSSQRRRCLLECSDPVVTLQPALQGIPGVDVVANNVLHHAGVATAHHDAALFGRNEVFGDRHAPRAIMMRLHDYCATVRIEQ